MSEVSVEELPPVGMVTLRGDLGELGTAVEAATGLAPPDRRMAAISREGALLWMSPDEFLLLCPHADAPDLAAELDAALSDTFATVAVVSDARRTFSLHGPDAENVMSRLCPVDFAAMAPTEVRRTRLAQIPAALWRQDGGWRIVCFRSVGRYAVDLLTNAAA
ncbi:MAG: sarcosine oxidase subunit gamma family protein [Jannaschia sp.]